MCQQKFLSKQKFRDSPPQSFQQCKQKLWWSSGQNGRTIVTVQHPTSCVSFFLSVIEILGTETPTGSQRELLIGTRCNSCFFTATATTWALGHLYFFIFVSLQASQAESPNCRIINECNLYFFGGELCLKAISVCYLLFHSASHSQPPWLTLCPVLPARWNPLHPDRRTVWAVVPPCCLHDRRHRKLVIQFCRGPFVSICPGRSPHLSAQASLKMSQSVFLAESY